MALAQFISQMGQFTKDNLFRVSMLGKGITFFQKVDVFMECLVIQYKKANSFQKMVKIDIRVNLKADSFMARVDKSDRIIAFKGFIKMEKEYKVYLNIMFVNKLIISRFSHNTILSIGKSLNLLNMIINIKGNSIMKQNLQANLD